MLIRLLNEDITKAWHVIRNGVRRSVPPFASGSDDSMKYILEALLKRFMQAWAIYDDGRIKGIGLTGVIFDGFSQEKALLVYSVVAYENIQDELWIDSLETLRIFAKGVNCKRVVFYTSNPRIVQLMKKLGSDTNTVFGTLSV